MNFEYLLSLINSEHSHEPTEHTHLEFPQNVNFHNYLKVSHHSSPRAGYFHTASESLYLLVDRDGDGSWENPHPLRLQYTTNQAYVFDNEIYHKGNLPIESGTWTPRLISSTTGSEPIYKGRAGIYKRVGGLVYIAFNFSTSSSIGGRGGNLQIHGLPYLSGDLGIETYVKFPVAQQSGFKINPGYQLSILLSQNQNFLSLWENDQHGDLHALTVLDLEANSLISVGGTYAI